jgi:hypothetical protein
MRRLTVTKVALATISYLVVPDHAKSLPLGSPAPLRATITPFDEVSCELPPWYAHDWVRNAPFLCQPVIFVVAVLLTSWDRGELSLPPPSANPVMRRGWLHL